MLPKPHDFFPPSRYGYGWLFLLFKSFPLFTIIQWTPLGRFQFMGKTSTESPLNLPGRYAWCIAEAIGPLNMLYAIYAIPRANLVMSAATSSILGTGLPFSHEFLAMLYIFHYINRAFVTPLFYAPSMSPIHITVALSMALFQFINSSCIAFWLAYSADESLKQGTRTFFPVLSLLGLASFAAGFLGNILSEHTLFELRRGAAKRKARSEGKAAVIFDKVYVVPPASGWFKHILYPHYVLEYLEWAGYWVLGGSLGLGWNTPALWFLLNELSTMTPRAVSGRKWYVNKFGAKAVQGRGGILPWL